MDLITNAELQERFRSHPPEPNYEIWLLVVGLGLGSFVLFRYLVVYMPQIERWWIDRRTRRHTRRRGFAVQPPQSRRVP